MGKFIFVLKHNWEWNLSTVLLYHRLSQMCSPQNLKNLRSLLCELVKIAKLSPRYLNELTCQKVFFTIICLVVTVLSKMILVLAKLRVRSSFKLEAISGWKVTSSVSKRTSLCNVRIYLVHLKAFRLRREDYCWLFVSSSQSSYLSWQRGPFLLIVNLWEYFLKGFLRNIKKPWGNTYIV